MKPNWSAAVTSDMWSTHRWCFRFPATKLRVFLRGKLSFEREQSYLPTEEKRSTERNFDVCIGLCWQNYRFVTDCTSSWLLPGGYISKEQMRLWIGDLVWRQSRLLQMRRGDRRAFRCRTQSLATSAGVESGDRWSNSARESLCYCCFSLSWPWAEARGPWIKHKKRLPRIQKCS